MNTGSAGRLIVGSLIVFSSFAAVAQNPVLKTRPKEDRDQQYRVTHRITLNVQVTDAAGKPISDLRADDFTLYDNHQPRRLVSFHPIDGAAQNDATQVLILLDAVNTPAPALDAGKAAIFKYLAESHKPLPFPTAFALWFNGHLSATPASTDRNSIGRAFVKMTKNVHSNACGIEQGQAQQKVSAGKNAPSLTPAACRAVHFKDSVAALDGIAQQQLATDGRTLLIWMGSGWPVVSDTEIEHLDTKQRNTYAREFSGILHDLRAAQITVYSLTPEGGSPININSGHEQNIDTSSAQSDAASPRIAVDEFAGRTGGRTIASSADLTEDLRTCIRDAEWYYSLAFNAPPAQNGSGELHTLQLKVNRPGVEIRTMDSYYSEPQ